MEIDWRNVQRVLLVRLRSIGDTVLATPSLIALKRFLPDARVDILLEEQIAPVLDGFDAVDNVLTVGSSSIDRLKTAIKLRRNRYDIVFNLHGGTTATFFTFASGARHRVGYTEYQYNFLYNHLLTSSADFWQRDVTHSAEQQLALLGSVGVPVEDRPKSRLVVTQERAEEIDVWLDVYGVNDERIALIHPAAAFQTKQWSARNFARIIEFVGSRGLLPVVVAGPNEKYIIDNIGASTKAFFHGFCDLSLPEITALASRSEIFVGNDSGIAHIAAAVNTPTVVIFGSSNRDHWRPWTDAPNEIVFESLPCQPCPGYECKVFGDPKCIQGVSVRQVTDAIEHVLINANMRRELLSAAT